MPTWKLEKDKVLDRLKKLKAEAEKPADQKLTQAEKAFLARQIRRSQDTVVEHEKRLADEKRYLEELQAEIDLVEMVSGDVVTVAHTSVIARALGISG